MATEHDQEMAKEAGMLGGCEAYNEARGQSLCEPEPCGQHCGYDCLRCGEAAEAAWDKAQTVKEVLTAMDDPATLERIRALLGGA